MRSHGSIVLILSILFAAFPSAGSETTHTPIAQQADGSKAQPASKPEMCKHKAPKDECFICDAKLREKGRLWCKEHERYEDRCWICHPEAQDKKRMFCNEHSLYEDECFLCHPELKKKHDKPSGAKAPKGQENDNPK